ncbi:diguanylate cyclase [Actinoplanes sp. NPDC000266]
MIGADHVAAVERAYELIEAAQGELSSGEVDAAADRIGRADRWDVQVLLHFARSLAVRESGGDDAPHVRAMLDVAQALDDPALHALALAVTAARRADARPSLSVGLDESPGGPLVRAVGLLDEAGGSPVVHRVAALIEVATVAHAMGFWELALELYERTDEVLADDPLWASTIRRQRVVLAVNRVELVLDWASAEALIGDWDAASARAAQVTGRAETTGWPAGWVRQYDGYLRLLGVLADVHGRASNAHTRAESVTKLEAGSDAYSSLCTAIRATRDGDLARAAVAAGGLAERFGLAAPPNTRLLAMQLAARDPRCPEAAARFAGELVWLRWKERLLRMANMREAIKGERRRREHEQLRREIVTDDLTGLANRRGFHAYLTERRDAETGSRDADAHAAVRDYAVMMIDVDRFKQVNDMFGHEVGDRVLARVAGILGAAVRHGDLAARLGGDEFAVILAGVRPDVARARAEAVLEAVRGHRWDELAPGLAVEVSIGLHHGSHRELPELLGDADRNLYAAKHDGRGRVAEKIH